MKSRLIKAQNQRVERISTSTLVVGIDIAKENHAAQAINFRGIVLTNRTIMFENSRSGFEHLERSIRKLQQTHLVSLTPEQMVETWRQYMSRPGGVRGTSKAKELIELARRSVGDPVALEEDKWELRHLLDEYDRVRQIIDGADELIQKVLPEIPCADLVRSVGASVPATAAILAFGGDFSKLAHGNQLLRKAGLNLAERSSGKYKGQIKLTKRGNSLLRKHLYFTVYHLLSHNRAFQSLHGHNLQEKRMSKMQSIMKLIGKLARMLVAMAREGQPFSPEKVQSPLAA